MSKQQLPYASGEGRPLASRDLLVVDDEPTVRDFLRRALDRNGYRCRVAADAAEALASVDADLPTLVISDIRMPGADGIWLLEQLKRRWPSLPVIMLSAVADAATAVQCLKEGAADYLTKPIDIDEFLIAVRRSTDFERLARENREFKNDLESMRAKSNELRSAFHVIETTYRDALNALTNVASGEPAHDRSARGSESAVEGSPELLALHAGARLISDSASFVEVAAGMAEKLVGGGAASTLDVFGPRGKAGELELIFTAGSEDTRLRSLSERSMSAGATRSAREENDVVMRVAIPVLVAGAPEAVLAVGWPGRDEADAISATERLSLHLATAIKLERDEREKRRIAEELELFQKLGIASRYSLDLHSVAHFLLDSLHRIVDYEVAGLLLLDEHQSLHVRTRSSDDPRLIDQVRRHVLNTLKLTYGVEPKGELDLRVRLLSPNGAAAQSGRKLRSFVNVPLTVGGRVAGLIHVSSGRERAFTEDDTMFLHRAANFLASSVQGVRNLLGTVKGRIEQMVEHMTDGVMMLDSRGAVVAMNSAARAQLRVEGDDDGPDRAELGRMLELDPISLVENERKSLRRVVCVHGVPYQLQLSPVFDQEDLAGAVVAFRNFTEEQRIDEMKSEFINVASHELRTPLTAIKNAVAILQGKRLGGELSDGQKRFLSLAQRNVDQLIALINDLLDLSKIESGKMRIELQLADVVPSIEAAVAALLPRAEQAAVSLETRLPGGLPEIYANLPSIQRIVTNLVGNALKFTESGGRVSVEAETARREDQTSLVQITISDTGVGIPKEDLESIFEKFHQVERNLSPSVAGTGLGLPITRELVKAHHGSIRAESGPGEGSRFIVELPVLTEEAYFQRELDLEIERARAERSTLSLLLLALADKEALKERLGSESYENCFATLVASTQRILHRSNDRVLARPELGVIAILLPKTDRAGSVLFEARLLEDLKLTDLTRTGITLTCGSAVCPDDGTTSKQLSLAAARSLPHGETISA